MYIFISILIYFHITDMEK